MISQDKLDELRKGLTLNRGSKVAVAKRAGVTDSMVSYVLSGKRKSRRVLKIAARVWLEFEEEKLEDLVEAIKDMDNAKVIAEKVRAFRAELDGVGLGSDDTKELVVA